MHRRRLTRVLIALAAPVLTIPAFAASAGAAAGVQVPGIDAVAKIYPHVENGTVHETTGKVHGPGKNCKPGKAIKGASMRSASYTPDYSSGDPDVYIIDGKRPMLSVTAMRFPSAKSAVKYLKGTAKSAKDCPAPGDGGGGGGGGGGSADCTTKMKKIAFKLGDQRWGYQYKTTCKDGGTKSSSVINMLFVRAGKHIVYTTAMSMDASAPSTKKSVKLTKLALKSV